MLGMCTGSPGEGAKTGILQSGETVGDSLLLTLQGEGTSVGKRKKETQGLRTLRSQRVLKSAGRRTVTSGHRPPLSHSPHMLLAEPKGEAFLLPGGDRSLRAGGDI